MSKQEFEELMNVNERVISAWASHVLEPHISSITYDSEGSETEPPLTLRCNKIPPGGFESQTPEPEPEP